MSLDGVLANANLVSFLNGLHGKQVLVETKAGQQFFGVFGASSPELEVGLTYAWLKTPANAKNILPKKDEIKEKMVFKFADIITISAVWSEEKNIKGFATDREYYNVKSNGRTDEEELEVWECENEDDLETDMPDQKQNYHKNGGWSVDEMFNTNSRLHGVQSTFVEDMSQYTTVAFEATEEEKARAEQIAREIEQSSRSKFYSRLENDDDERDLDKATNDDEHDPGSKRRSNNSSFGNNPSGRNRNDRGGPANRRADGLRGDRKNSGQQPLQQQQQPQQRFSQASYSTRGAPYTMSTAKRNSTGDDQFGGEWHNPPKEPQRSKDGGKIFENTNYKGRMERGVRGDKGRMDSLKQWNHEFSNAYKPTKQDDAKEQNEPAPRPIPETSENAWNNGPPVSLLNSQTVPSGAPAGDTQGPSEEAREMVEQMDQLSLEDEKQADDSQSEDREKSETSEASKKFTFNPNAPAFTPRQQPTPTTPTQTGPMQQIPMGMVPGMTMQGAIAPGMVVPSGQPMIGPWHPGYVQMPTAPYQVYMPSQSMMGNIPMQGQRGNGPVSQMGNYSNQQAQRRNPGQQPVMVPGGQWTNQVVVQPMGYYPYQGGAGQQAQQFANNPQMVAQGQQGMPAQMYQQRYPAGYMVPQSGQQPRFPVSQQGSHPDGNGQYQSSGASTTGPSSQPPTPGPQPPTVASPAQHPHPSGRGSPAPPAAQQFVPQSAAAHAIGPQSQPTYYPTPPNSMYMYNQQGPVILTYAAGQMPMASVQSEGQTHSHMDMQPHQQFIAHEQYGQFMSGSAYYQQQQPMSRQNSIPQNAYNGQPPSAPPPPASHPSSTTAPAQQPPPSAPSNLPQN